MRILFFFLLLTPVVSVATTVKCSNAEYANKELRFYRLADPISGDTEHAFSLKFDANGTANASINHSLTLYTFSDFGVYRGMLLLEPGKTITLKLPPFREKSFGDQKNPYFSPVSFWFHSESSIHLTDKVSSFDQKLNSLTNKYFNELYLSQSKTVFDSVQLRLNNSFPEVSPQAFNLHKQLRLKFIKADIFRQRPEEYSEFFTDIKDEFWIHQEFVALFEKTFNEQLSFSAKAIGGKEIFTAVEKQDMKALLSFVEKKFKTTGEMADLVLLKLLHDGFYSNDFSQTTIKNMIASPFFSNHSNPLIKKASRNIIHKITFLQQGNKAPKICLSDLTGIRHCSNNRSDKFKYIVFADVETVVCKEHLKYLGRINELFHKHLEIFVVLRETKKDDMVKFFAENETAGINMIDIGNNYIEKYKVRSFPGCYLLDEEHKVQFAHTKAPLDGFEQQFGTFLRNELFMRQREQYQNKN